VSPTFSNARIAKFSTAIVAWRAEATGDARIDAPDDAEITVRIDRVTVGSDRSIPDIIIEASRVNISAVMVIMVIMVIISRGTSSAAPRKNITEGMVTNIEVPRMNTMIDFIDRKVINTVIKSRTANTDSLLVVQNTYNVIAGTVIGNDATWDTCSKKNCTRAFHLLNIIFAVLDRVTNLPSSLRYRSLQ